MEVEGSFHWGGVRDATQVGDGPGETERTRGGEHLQKSSLRKLAGGGQTGRKRRTQRRESWEVSPLPKLVELNLTSYLENLLYIISGSVDGGEIQKRGSEANAKPLG